MGLFYRVPADLEDVNGRVQHLLHVIAGAGESTPPGMLEDIMPEVSAELVAAMNRLRAEGRADEVKRYKKHVMKVATFMDNGHYNHVFYPWIKNLF